MTDQTYTGPLSVYISAEMAASVGFDIKEFARSFGISRKAEQRIRQQIYPEMKRKGLMK